jgi:hypothetical protein
MPQATRSNDHHTYRCYLRGPDGFVGLRSADLGHISNYPVPPVTVKRSGGWKAWKTLILRPFKERGSLPPCPSRLPGRPRGKPFPKPSDHPMRQASGR